MLINHSKQGVIVFCLVSSFLHILKKRYSQSKGHLEIDKENNWVTESLLFEEEWER